MLSFRAELAEAEALRRWAERLGSDRSAVLREALHRHLVRLGSADDAATWASLPLTTDEQALGAIAEWGPAEDWSDWIDEPDATR